MARFTKSEYGHTSQLHYIAFWLFPIIYFLALGFALYLTYGTPWVWASLLIGMIYIGSSIIAFYLNHFDEYMKEGEDASYVKLLTSVVLWSMLNLTIQVFILLGFWMTVDAPKLKQNIYIHPCYYGRIYKHTDSMLAQMDSTIDVDLLEEPEKLEAYREKRDAFLVRFCAPHLKPMKEADSSKTDKKKGRPEASGMDRKSPEEYGQGSGEVASEGHEEPGSDSTEPEGKSERPGAKERTPREIEEEIYKIPFYVAIAFGFLGALIYTLIDIRERVASKKLDVSCTARYLIRFIVAPTVCIVFAYFISSDWWTHLAPITFFCIGYCPDAALKWMMEKFPLISAGGTGSREGEAAAKAKEPGAMAGQGGGN